MKSDKIRIKTDDGTFDIETDRPYTTPPAAAKTLKDLQTAMIDEILRTLKLTPPGYGAGAVDVGDYERVRTLVAHFSLEIMRL